MVSIARSLRRWIALACVLPLAAGTLVACGGGDSNDDSSSSGAGGTTSGTTSGGGGGGGGGGATLAEAAQESGGLSFSKPTLTAKAGKVTITISNPDGNQFPHAIEVEGNGIEEETSEVQPGGDASVTVDLKPGTYEFYCPVSNHRDQGMEGELTVS